MFHNHFSGQKFAEELHVFSSFLFPWKSSLYSQPSQFCAGIVIQFHCPGLLNSWITAIMKPSLSWFYSEWNYQTMQDSNDRPSTKLNVCIEECMMHLTNYRNWKQWCFCFYNLFRADVALMGLKVTDGIIKYFICNILMKYTMLFVFLLLISTLNLTKLQVVHNVLDKTLRMIFFIWLRSIIYVTNQLGNFLLLVFFLPEIKNSLNLCENVIWICCQPK